MRPIISFSAHFFLQYFDERFHKPLITLNADFFFDLQLE